MQGGFEEMAACSETKMRENSVNLWLIHLVSRMSFHDAFYVAWDDVGDRKENKPWSISLRISASCLSKPSDVTMKTHRYIWDIHPAPSDSQPNLRSTIRQEWKITHQEHINYKCNERLYYLLLKSLYPRTFKCMFSLQYYTLCFKIPVL